MNDRLPHTSDVAVMSSMTTTHADPRRRPRIPRPRHGSRPGPSHRLRSPLLALGTARLACSTPETATLLATIIDVPTLTATAVLAVARTPFPVATTGSGAADQLLRPAGGAVRGIRHRASSGWSRQGTMTARPRTVPAARAS